MFSVTVKHFRTLSSAHVLSGLAQCGPHGDEGEIVGVWETLMSCQVEGLPREGLQTPLCCGAIYCLRDQLESHLVVCHLYREKDRGRELEEASADI